MISNLKQQMYFSKKLELIFKILLVLFAISCIFPFLFVVIISLTDEKSLALNGYQLWPKEWSMEAYRFIFGEGSQLITSLGVTLMITVIGTIIAVFMTGTYAYVLSRNSFPFRKFFTFYLFFTMLFAGGLVPSYLVMTKFLGLKNTIWALILPLAFSPYNVIVLRTFFKKSIPESIIESAKMDGASEMRVFFQIVLPLALPGVATIGLFASLGYWNDWFNALLYIDNNQLLPLQYLLMKIQNTIDYMARNTDMTLAQQQSIQNSLPQESIRMAMVVVATVPIAIVYPFFQKYFVQGLTIGGVKE
ncbi:carbohydrate ABC transporter permease [Enterococcus aquimarinus]|uniref:Carbohydrate ABC superfamily ATP binding cassette transporter, membrane protein n=1 Tax=Enterococcus aquimarinus TaxID=328396 RepID=A0A1L8QQL0_9ENTE|nr:carbohydrate ABC transporter permease [Enterococcus aquimarinus]OJG09726.1 carbohydrate ABC superfamily ATP binding cassette transporter, membrane protein [Enterococcus aquimarinus]